MLGLERAQIGTSGRSHRCNPAFFATLSSWAAKERAMRYLIGLTKLAMVGVVAGGVTASAFAQEKGREKEHTQTNEPVLAGPKVKETRIPGVEETFGGAERMAGMSERVVPLPVFREALGALMEEGIDEDVRLTAAQERTLREMGEAHAAAVRELMAQHKDEIDALRKAAREQAGKSGRDVAPQRGGSDAASRMRRRMGEIRRKGPSDSALQTRLWSVLNEDQRALVEIKIKAWREEQEHKRMDQMTQRYLDQRRDAAKDAPRRDRLANMGPTDALSSKLRERIAKLEPQARRRLIERLSKRWLEREASERKRDGPTDAMDEPKRKRGG
jgi:hypothetical protein